MAIASRCVARNRADGPCGSSGIVRVARPELLSRPRRASSVVIGELAVSGTPPAVPGCRRPFRDDPAGGPSRRLGLARWKETRLLNIRLPAPPCAQAKHNSPHNLDAQEKRPQEPQPRDLFGSRSRRAIVTASIAQAVEAGHEGSVQRIRRATGREWIHGDAHEGEGSRRTAPAESEAGGSAMAQPGAGRQSIPGPHARRVGAGLIADRLELPNAVLPLRKKAAPFISCPPD